MIKSWTVALSSFWDFNQEIFRNLDFDHNSVANSRNRYFIFYTRWFYQKFIIIEGFVSFWMIAYSFLANFAVKPGFLGLFFKNPPLWIFLSNHSCFYANKRKFYFAHDVGNLIYFLNIYTFKLPSHTYEKI